MVNGFSQVGTAETVVYYDAPQFADFWSSANALGRHSTCIHGIRAFARAHLRRFPLADRGHLGLHDGDQHSRAALECHRDCSIETRICR